MTIRRSFRNENGTLRRHPYRVARREQRPVLCIICRTLEPQYQGSICARCYAEVGVGA
jgi:hypothetical protein